MKRQTIIDYITAEFGAAEEHLWMSAPDYAVFRNAKNKKWFAIIMNIERSKLYKKGEGIVNIINLKSEPALIGSLLLKTGYYPAYHMNKQNWITVLLDGSVDVSEIKSLVNLSYNLIDKQKDRRKANERF